MTQLYTVLGASGEPIAQSYTRDEAARALLTYDGHDWAIKPESDGKGWRLWTTRFSRNSPSYLGLTRSVIFSLESDALAAEADIFQQVIEHPDGFKGCDVLTDEDYAEILRQNEEG